MPADSAPRCFWTTTTMRSPGGLLVNSVDRKRWGGGKGGYSYVREGRGGVEEGKWGLVGRRSFFDGMGWEDIGGRAGREG